MYENEKENSFVGKEEVYTREGGKPFNIVSFTTGK
jgi:hypothetical protein